MTDLVLTQALFENDLLLARSDAFPDPSQEIAADLARKFGPVPADGPTDVLFVQPFGKDRLAIVRVRGSRFHFLILANELYHLLQDPFAIAERYPVDWAAHGILPDLAWPPEPLPRRTIKELDELLKKGDGPYLLGAAQTLVDGGKIVIAFTANSMYLIRGVWALLPESNRRTIRVATFATSNNLEFDLLALAAIPAGGLPGYLNEDQVLEYPDSRYERDLQIAIEHGDQRELDRLLARKSTQEMIRLAWKLIVVALVVSTVVKILNVLRIL